MLVSYKTRYIKPESIRIDQQKLDRRSRKAVFIGYPPDTKGYTVFIVIMQIDIFQINCSGEWSKQLNVNKFRVSVLLHYQKYGTFCHRAII